MRFVLIVPFFASAACGRDYRELFKSDSLNILTLRQSLHRGALANTVALRLTLYSFVNAINTRPTTRHLRMTRAQTNIFGTKIDGPSCLSSVHGVLADVAHTLGS